MLKKNSSYILFWNSTSLLLLLGIFFFASCTNTKKVVYFEGAKDEKISSNILVPETIIQKNDILSISISDLNPEAAGIFNTTGAGGIGGGTSNAVGSSEGYLVSTDGYIQFPFLGNIKAEGLTKDKLKDKIAESIIEKKLLLQPIVTIRFVNFRVTILGEVNHPTVVTVPNEKISLLEAIGLAGDLTLYAKRDNVMIIREEQGKKEIKRLNLNSTELFTSPYYYLQSNDIVYVEPNNLKVASTNRSTLWLPVIFSALSFAAIVVQQTNK